MVQDVFQYEWVDMFEGTGDGVISMFPVATERDGGGRQCWTGRGIS